ncbi:helix-turn-helix domain-containing GNAT family N-acetyltransferase [Poseidonocella sp. HB161398]|uniref:bifunctional helix-turn-helix transcriptional regulator/GNAT family N-acetyltransferase n=1 Tax=Poseidonocella sp. HB161398 TaxID=2320855 RepID=UPI001107FB9A|nr:helix-turn-helix domain-containing GNAT family N-acetyltransferase [Poseidonocella sp. HB161398]
MPLDPVARFRRFARAVTAELGALDQSFLGRGRPLGAARVLNAIGRGQSDLAAIRAHLGLDSGLASRLLRALEDEGLVETVRHPGDGRRRILRLTADGAAEYAAYEKLSDDRAAKLLGGQADAGALLDAMDRIALALGRQHVEIAEADPRSAPALHCLGEYYAELGRRFAQGFDVSLSRDPQAADMVPPKGSFLLAYSDGLPAGCVGIKGAGDGTAEIKRLWVDPLTRGHGLARRLMTASEDRARELGIRVLRLDTNSALPEAVALYRRTGWTEIPRFNDDPYPDLFFEKAL